MNRRQLFGLFTSGIAAGSFFAPPEAEAGPRGAVRRHRRVVRRRVRRRIRRRAIVRMMHGRPVWIVPVGLVAGWELVHEKRIVVVQETKFVELDGVRTEVAIVRDSGGTTEQVAVAREDTADNRENLEGSLLPDDDRKTPGVEAEVEEKE